MISEETTLSAPRGPTSVTPDGRSPESQPRWRRDFPIDWAEDDYVSRRDLVKFIVLTIGSLAMGQVWIAIKSFLGRHRAPAERVAVATVNELSVGGAKTFEYPKGSTPRLLVRTGPSAFVAYDQLCTHLQCPVIPRPVEGKLHCPCHNGWFDLHSGRPLAGPPRRSLPRVLLEVQENTVYATGVQDSAT